MQTHLAPVYDWARSWSRKGLAWTVLLLAALRIFSSDINISLQLVVALVALLVGIPHGAIDHLVAIPSQPRSRFLTYILIYVVIAVVAGWAIATWNVLGFQIVVVMSALHFGFGDAAYLNERLDSLNQPRNPVWVEIIYAIPAGFLPVVLPLTDHRTLDALNRINPHLDHWAGNYGHQFRLALLILAAFAIIFLQLKGLRELSFDLILLLAMSLFAPPLIAFAAYFGFWHALRHTARLVPKLRKSDALAREGQWRESIRGAIAPGLYAVVGTIAIALLLMVNSPDKFSSSLLWATLVIIWALTVPHMLTTASFDSRALKSDKTD